MNVLLLHSNFPAQFRNLAPALASNPHNRVVYCTAREEGQLPGVHKVLFKPVREVAAQTHPYVRNVESAALTAQAVYRALLPLRQQGFIPDVIFGHSGWGNSTLMKDLFPEAKLLCYYEWFYRSQGSDVGFAPGSVVTPDDQARIRVKNAAILLDLYSCDWGLSPTMWQWSQFPAEFRGKFTVLHDGVNTRACQPLPEARLQLPGLDLSDCREIITYVARGMEPYRGFPQFIEAMSLLLQRRPNCHVVIVGQDRVAYGPPLPEGQTFKQLMLEKFPLDINRVHFTGLLPYNQLIKVLQASTVHVYLTYPFVLSWSMLEAMACGCLVLGSATAPVQEVIQDHVNGLLVNFFSPQQICDRIVDALDRPQAMAAIRKRARETVMERYDLFRLLPRHIELLENLAAMKA